MSEKPVAEFKIRNAPGMTEEGILGILNWLEGIQKTLNRERDKLTDGWYKSRYMVTK